MIHVRTARWYGVQSDGYCYTIHGDGLAWTGRSVSSRWFVWRHLYGYSSQVARDRHAQRSGGRQT